MTEEERRGPIPPQKPAKVHVLRSFSRYAWDTETRTLCGQTVNESTRDRVKIARKLSEVTCASCRARADVSPEEGGCLSSDDYLALKDADDLQKLAAKEGVR